MFHHKQSLRLKLMRTPSLKKLANNDRDFKEIVKMFEAVCYVDPMEIEDYMVSISIVSLVNASTSLPPSLERGRSPEEIPYILKNGQGSHFQSLRGVIKVNLV